MISSNFKISSQVKIVIIIVLLLIIVLLCCNYNKSNFMTVVPNEYPAVKTIPTIAEQKIENDEFLKEYNKIEKQTDNDTPIMWNPNNTLESINTTPCLEKEGRLTCYSAPSWWYPNDKYDPKKFREIYYGDSYNPIYNYLGNAQEMYWDFKSTKTNDAI
jgi:hypothetical protein